MNNSVGRILVIGLILLVLILVLGPCLSTGPPAVDPRVLNRQIDLVNQSLDSLQEEVAAAQAPSRWPFILFLISILLPLAAGIWLLCRCERSAIGHDQVIRTMIKVGLKEPVIRAYLDDRGPLLRLPSGEDPAPPSTPSRWNRSFRRRRRWRARNEDEA